MDQLEVRHTEVDRFIFCLEVVADVDVDVPSEVVAILEDMAHKQHVTSIYKTCDTIEGLEDSLNNLLYNDHHFKDYEIIYLVLPGEGNNLLVNGYYYSMEEIAELFEGKMEGKIIHFANKKILDLDSDESQYFLGVTGARALSGYGVPSNTLTSAFTLDRLFFGLFNDNDNLREVVETMFFKHTRLCQLLDFRLYY